MDLTNTYLGFTDNMKPMQKARAEKLLDSKKRYNGTVLTNKQFVVNQIIEGSIPEFKDDITHWSRKINDYTKPKIEYYLKTKHNSYWTIEKTLYNFAIYLIAKEFTYEARVEDFIKEEQERKETEQQRLEQEKLDREQEKENEKQRKIKYNNWVNEQAENYNNSEQLNLLREIRLAELGEFSQHSVKLLVLIDNIDDYFCKEALKGWLHSGNKTSKKVFYHITGIKLPATNKGTYELLDNITSSNYKGIVPYKKRQKHEKNFQAFYRMMIQPVPHFEDIQAEVFNKYGLEMFITYFEGKCTISEATSGMKMVEGVTKKMAMERLEYNIDKIGIEKVKEHIQEAIKRYGVSPKYKED
jgi:hypothetical protein